ncbi:ABC transporter ATP-binding protein [Mycobacterium palustre]|uniref:Sulfonate ABC transporter ATP-binding protein n=1 Tax=Mycobacterium palustre TaxID=153971 RepID=A0A1X1ZZK9_9MYCO|nr:ABC transporter ATP-binding protein [Mycobacterium palustre]MCV7100190.1 ABC transporter ATP-binding protein [Mycobacterium palustre]ORW32910.1 sulfonate ABC transporter ATP-binding protein [Mycobacterium palustre]
MTVTTQRQTTVVGRLSNVDKWYDNRQVLHGISLEIGTHEIVALVGRSGSGKSTVLRVLAGLAPDHTGRREVVGAPAVAFQEPRLLPWRDVLTNVRYGLNRTALSHDAAQKRSEQALAEIGLAEHASAWPLTLSGGQAQRVSLARALVAEPRLLLLDEPFGALDALTRLSMRALLLDLWRHHGFGVLLVTHDVDEAIELADRVLILQDGRIADTIEIEHPRPTPSTRTAEHDQYRVELLDKLGVRL